MKSKIAAIQMSSTADLNENLAIAERSIEQAAQTGAQLVVLPEMFAVMGATENDKLAVKEEIGQGKIQAFLAEQAKNNNIWLIGGTIPIRCQNTHKIKAASLVFNNTGQLVARYDKIHLFDVTLSSNEIYHESATTSPGDTLVILDSPIGKLGLAVCYDVRFPEMFRALANAGAEIFILPTAFTYLTGQAHWHALTRSRAIENFCYLIGACQWGMHANGKKTYGHSLIIEPWGQIIASLDDGDGVITAEVDLDKIQTARKRVPVLEHQINPNSLNLSCK
jgi:nitrilase